ncbi:MAG: class I SAM-dependent methyltransferase [Iamia sp.]
MNVDVAQAEFDVVAGWTADAVDELGADHAVPAACRGSGSPSALDWLSAGLGLARGRRLLDCGAGTGGPAAYARARTAAVPLLAEPMLGACRAARRMFAQPTVVAPGGQMPLRDRSIDTAWSLGVLSTTPDRDGLLAELHRVLRPRAPLGLMVLVRVVDQLTEQPVDNHFPTGPQLDRSLSHAGFVVEARCDLTGLPSAPAEWERRADLVEEVVARDHRGDPRWIAAEESAASIGRLLGDGQIEGRLLQARRA